MSDLRRELLDTSDAPPELSPDLRFLASRQAALGALLQDHADRYRALHAAIETSGPTPQTTSSALEAAVNLATLLQSLRRREDLQVALASAPGFIPTPLLAIDQLCFSFSLLTSTDADEREAALTPEEVDELLRSNRVRDWLRGLGRRAPGE